MVSVTDAEARRFVSDHFDRRAGDVRPLGAGEWSRAYAFILDGREAVIRFGDHVEDFRKDQVMAAYTCPALPIPAVIEIGTAGDSYFAVSECARGVPLDGLDSAGIRAALPGLRAGTALGPARRAAARPAPPPAGLPGAHRLGRDGLQRLPRSLR